MVTRSFTRLALTAALLFGAAGAAVAWANADALIGLNVQALVPSGPPSLLGPINELGRTGWQCRPEKAADAQHAKMAELPTDAQP
jgi:hypothetical protein